MTIRLSKNSFSLLYLSACIAVFFALMLVLGLFHILDPAMDWIDSWGGKILTSLWFAYILNSIYINRPNRKTASPVAPQAEVEIKTDKVTIANLTFVVTEAEVRLTVGRRLLLILVLLGWGVFLIWVMSISTKSLYMVPIVLLLIPLSLSLIINYFEMKWRQ